MMSSSATPFSLRKASRLLFLVLLHIMLGDGSLNARPVPPEGGVRRMRIPTLWVAWRGAEHDPAPRNPHSRRNHKQAAGKRSLDDRGDGCMHRDVLLFDARQAAQSRLRALNRKRRAKRDGQGNLLRGRADRCAAALSRGPSLGSLAAKMDKCPIIRQIDLAQKSHPTPHRPASKALQ